MTLVQSDSKVLEADEHDIGALLAAQAHLGTKNLSNDMRHYVFGRRKDGVHVFNLAMLWEKLVLAARVIVTIENPSDVVVISGRPYGQRAILKFAHYTGAQYLAGRFTPGGFTNQSQKSFIQPRLLIVTDPRVDHQAVLESSYVNVPVIGFCDTDSPLKYIDVAIPANNRGRKSIAVLYWLLAREVLRMRGQIMRQAQWEVKPDLFLFRDPEEVTRPKEEETTITAPTNYPDAAASNQLETGAATHWGEDTTWGADAGDKGWGQ